jgi:6-phosphogluconolactonase
MIVLHDRKSPLGVTVHVAGEVASAAGPLVTQAIARTVERTGRCRIGLSGGSSPAPLYAYLRHNLPEQLYNQLLVTWVDERHLPLAESDKPTDWRRFHADSNLRLAYEHWLAHVPLPSERVLPMSLGGDLKAETLRFGRAFLDHFQGGLDVAILGAGPDGHVASIFPDHPGLEVSDVCFAVHDSPKPPPQRITLGFPVLRAVGYTALLATGGAKSEVLRRAWHGDKALPLGRLQTAGEQHWFLDPAAAVGILNSEQ